MWVFLVCLAANAWFYQAGGWGQNTRFNLVRALVEQGTIRIDDYHANTGDKAFRDGHYYCDKAPGQPLLSVPFVAVAHWLSASAFDTTDAPARIALLSYTGTLAGAALPGALAAWCLFLLASRLTQSQVAAAAAALALGLTTPWWAYSTLMWGHVLCGAGLFIAFAAAVALRDTSEASASRDRWLGATVGLGAGWAVVSEYPAAPCAVLIALLALWQVRQAGRWRILRVLIPLAGTALACAAVMLTYNTLAFGSPTRLGYTEVQGWEGMQQGFLGLTYPRLDVIERLLISQYRGLLPMSPIVVAGVVGLFLMLRSAVTRLPAAVALLIGVYYLLFNASYHYWHGGWSLGPRHMAPALPFLCLGVAALWALRWRWVMGAITAAMLWGFVHMLAAVSTTPQPPETISQPYRKLIWPAFGDGRLSLNPQGFDDYHADAAALLDADLPRAAWNLGHQLGLSGHWSLLPLLVLIALGLVAIMRPWRAGCCGLSPVGPSRSAR